MRDFSFNFISATDRMKRGVWCFFYDCNRKNYFTILKDKLHTRTPNGTKWGEFRGDPLILASAEWYEVAMGNHIKDISLEQVGFILARGDDVMHESEAGVAYYRETDEGFMKLEEDGVQWNKTDDKVLSLTGKWEPVVEVEGV